MTSLAARGLRQDAMATSAVIVVVAVVVVAVAVNKGSQTSEAKATAIEGALLVRVRA